MAAKNTYIFLVFDGLATTSIAGEAGILQFYLFLPRPYVTAIPKIPAAGEGGAFWMLDNLGMNIYIGLPH